MHIFVRWEIKTISGNQFACVYQVWGLSPGHGNKPNFQDFSPAVVCIHLPPPQTVEDSTEAPLHIHNRNRGMKRETTFHWAPQTGSQSARQAKCEQEKLHNGQNIKCRTKTETKEKCGRWGRKRCTDIPLVSSTASLSQICFS